MSVLGCQIKHLTAYHPQAQGLIERPNRFLKASLRAYEESCQWYHNLPYVLLALCNSPKQDLHSLSPANFVFGGSVRLPGEFFAPKTDNPTPTYDYISNFSKYIANLTYHQPRATHCHSHLDPTLFSSQCSHMYIRTDTYKPPLAPHYKGPFPVISKNGKYFVIDFRTHNNVVSINRLKAANLSFEMNSQVAADHSTLLQENFSMPATPPPPPSPEQSHPLRTRHKADSPHNCTKYCPAINQTADHMVRERQHAAYRKRYIGDPDVMLHLPRCSWTTKKLHLPRCSWTAAPSIKQQNPSLSRRAQTSRPPSK